MAELANVLDVPKGALAIMRVEWGGVEHTAWLRFDRTWASSSAALARRLAEAFPAKAEDYGPAAGRPGARQFNQAAKFFMASARAWIPEQPEPDGPH